MEEERGEGGRGRRRRKKASEESRGRAEGQGENTGYKLIAFMMSLLTPSRAWDPAERRGRREKEERRPRGPS